MFVSTHTCSTTHHICVTPINLLLSLFGPCLESQCTLCGEPEGEWAFAIFRKLSSLSSLGLLLAAGGGREVERGRHFTAETMFFSLHLQMHPTGDAPAENCIRLRESHV